jgi:DNA-binding transcriptional MerR regulator
MTDNLSRELAACSAGQAARIVGVSVQTLNNWRKAGRIEAKQDAAGRYRYDVRPFVKAETDAEQKRRIANESMASAIALCRHNEAVMAEKRKAGDGRAKGA